MVATIATAPLNIIHTKFRRTSILHSCQGTCAASISQVQLLHLREALPLHKALLVVAGACPREWPTNTIRCFSAAALSNALTNGPGSDPVLPAAAIIASLSTKPCRQESRPCHEADAGLCACAHACSHKDLYIV